MLHVMCRISVLLGFTVTIIVLSLAGISFRDLIDATDIQNTSILVSSDLCKYQDFSITANKPTQLICVLIGSKNAQ